MRYSLPGMCCCIQMFLFYLNGSNKAGGIICPDNEADFSRLIFIGLSLSFNTRYLFLHSIQSCWLPPITTMKMPRTSLTGWPLCGT